MKIECVYCGAPVMEPKAYGAIKCTYCRKSNLVDGFETSADDGEIKLNNGHLSNIRFSLTSFSPYQVTYACNPVGFKVYAF